MRPAARLRRLSHVLLLAALMAALWGGAMAWRDAAAWQQALSVPVAGWAPGQVVAVENLWVTRQPGGEFRVFQTRSGFYPDRQVIWMADRNRFVEPISSAEYLIEGVGVFGPAGNLYEVAARLEGDVLKVIPDRVIGGGPTGDPAWTVRLKSWLRRLIRGCDPTPPPAAPGIRGGRPCP